jgi:enoyl-CoA hydratase/carnithine racemase
MSTENVRLEYQDYIAIITLDRPSKRNALNEQMFSLLEAVTTELKSNMPRVVILTGEGDKAFCAGFDVHPDNPMNEYMLRAAEKNDTSLALKSIGRIREVVDALIALPIPIIAAVNGLAFGGGAEIAVRCDLRVMDPDAVICFSETRLGLMPDFGGTPNLVRLVGPSVAADLILTARKISAQEALDLKLTNRVSAPGRSLNKAVALAESISANGPRATRAALEVIRRSQSLSLKDALSLELDRAAALLASGEFIYGVSAFLEKRLPDFPD